MKKTITNLTTKRVKKYLFTILIIFVSITSFFNEIYAEDKKADKTLSPYFFIEGNNTETEQFPLKDTNVEVNINGVIAGVKVTQHYENTGTKPINAKYVFPASTRAAVNAMTMTIGNQVIKAKIKEKQQAKQEFEQAKKEGKSASLLEQKRPNVFTMDLANIMPRDKVKIELEYTELLVPDEGTYEFVYPTVVGPRYSNQPEETAPHQDKWVKSPYLMQSSKPNTTFNITTTLSTGIPLQEALCKSHEIDIKWENQSLARVELKNTGEFAGNRDYILNYRLTGKEIQSGLMLYEGKDENFFLLMMQPPEKITKQDIPPREYIFIIDVSGSMFGYPLSISKELIKNLIGNLKESDLFNVLLFAGSSKLLAEQSVPATSDNIKNAIAVIDSQQGGGATELLPAMKHALSVPKTSGFSRSIVIVTDGYISVEREAFEIIRNNLDNTNFFAFGIGSSVNRYLIEGIAKTGQGIPFIVTEEKEADWTAAKFREYIKSPVLTDIKAEFNGLDVYDVEPVKIPDLFSQRPIIVFGKYKGNAKGEIVISGQHGENKYKKSFVVSDSKPLETNSALQYLWARKKLERLSDYTGEQENEASKKDIIEIGLKYNLLTKYTSFIAVTEMIRNTEGTATDVNQPLPLPKNVSELAVGGYQNASEPETLAMLGILIFALFLKVISKMKFDKIRENRI